MMKRRPGSVVVALAALGGCVPPLWAADDDLRLPAPTFPVASALHEAHRSADALAVLERQLDGLNGDDLPTEAQLLRATLLAAVSRHQDGEALWAEIVERERSLTAFALRALVSSLAGRGEPAQAEARLTELLRATSARQQVDLILTVADSHRGAGHFAEAAALYGLALRSRAEVPLPTPHGLGSRPHRSLQAISTRPSRHSGKRSFNTARPRLLRPRAPGTKGVSIAWPVARTVYGRSVPHAGAPFERRLTVRGIA